ncbi:MAG: hypothetical protein BIFFINMI_00582 [Phycisphaerae bacterium]|nr:hypothetical protein [Phycisphaerae bacterium]
MNSADSIAERRLLDRLAPAAIAEEDPILGLVGTTYNLQPDFFDTDFLPAILGLGAWDDRGWATRIAIENRLSRMEAATIFMEPNRYDGRPRSLRVEVPPASGLARQTLHAKVLIVLREQTVQLVVGSANLSESGYRHNREVATSVTASAKSPQQAPLIRSAIAGLRERLNERLTAGAILVLDRCSTLLNDWSPGGGGDDGVDFLWGGGPIPLWQAFLDRWPRDEKARSITVVSPFWSEDGERAPLRQLLAEMSRRGVLDAEAAVYLVTDTDIDARGAYRPKLPPSYATCDLSAFGARAVAQAADPRVSAEEVAGLEGFLGRRCLHAKVLLLEGPTSSLAFAGSANFTHSGWGLLDDPTSANIEAGIVILRTGRGRGEVRDLIPAPIGAVVELGDGTAGALAPPDPSPAEAPWPDFIREIVLVPLPDRQEELCLMVRVNAEQVAGPWTIALPARGDLPARALLASTDPPTGPADVWRVPLGRETLNQLLVGQEVSVSWWAWQQGRMVPVNVDASARESLPISPGSPDLREEHLVAYYQGQIRWEDLFPDPEMPPPTEVPSGQTQLVSEVDTSKIQSYQIREFVEAISGIRADLRDAVHSEPAMKLAVLGPVSPIALTRTIMEAVKAGSRTPIAAGFQLVEILACIESARTHEVPTRLTKAWEVVLDRASAEICQFLTRLRDEHSEALRASRMFDRYEAAVRKYCRGGEGNRD